MDGCDYVLLFSPSSPKQPEREKRAIDVAKRAGVQHVVALSVMGASRSSPVAFARWHAEIDAHLAASGLEYTILRPMNLCRLICYQSILWCARVSGTA